MAGVVTVNGTAMSNYPLVGLEGWAAALELQYQSVAIPGQRYVHDMPYPTVNPRAITLRLLVTCSTVAARGVALDTLMGYFPLDQELTLSFDDDTSKVVYGRVTRESSVSVAPETSFAIPDVIMSYEITCHDPCKWDATNTVVTCTAALVTVGVGSVDCGGIFTVTGAATNPTLSYASGGATSTIAVTLGFSLAVATGDSVAIDLDQLTAVYTYATGTTTNVLANWNSGDWFRFDPADKTGSSMPQLKVSSGAGSLTYRRKWRS